MREQILARRYAQVFGDILPASSQEAQVRRELSGLERKLAPRRDFLRHPRISRERKKECLRSLLPSRAHVWTLHFLDFLLSRKQLALLGKVLSEWEKIAEEKEGILRAQVRAARALSSQEKEHLRDRLTRWSGKKVRLEIREDPGLIGGVKVRLGDWALDGSVKHQLEILKRRLFAAGG